jgi:hypothetical protein
MHKSTIEIFDLLEDHIRLPVIWLILQQESSELLLRHRAAAVEPHAKLRRTLETSNELNLLQDIEASKYYLAFGGLPLQYLRRLVQHWVFHAKRCQHSE